jgi:hypothetical protein
MTGLVRRTGSARGAAPGAGNGRRLWRRVALAAVLVALAAGLQSPASATTAVGRPGSFGLTPAPTRNGRAAPYFMLSMAPGQSAVASALVSNLGPKTERIKLSRTTGVTAANGGSAFSRYLQKCSGVGCWVTGLPRLVTLAPRRGEKLSFRVRVPPGTRPGQYLAGITAQLAKQPRPVTVGSNGKARAQAVIVEQITVAVAVTVGSPAQLTTRLRIRRVTGEAIGTLPRLNLALYNTGQTFAHGAGQATCTVRGKRHSWPVYAATVLMHDHALIPANARGIPLGATVPCSVYLRYGDGLIARWKGLVTFPDPPRVRIYHTGLGDYSVVPVGGTPPWAIALIVLGVLVLLTVVALLIRMRRRGHSRAALEPGMPARG